MKFNTVPPRTISCMLTWPVPNTIAFGTVATGSMKAQDADMAAGTIISSGLTPTATAVAAKMGISKVVVAVLEVISVRNVTLKQMHKMSKGKGKVANTVNCCAISSAKPLEENALAMVMPLANSSNMPQGMSTAVFQSNS